MTQTFIPAMRKLFIDSGYDMKEDGDAAAHDSQFLIVVRGVIYPVFEDYSWDRDVRGIYCSGSGADIALGAIEAFANSRKQTTPKVAELDIRMAIKIASRWDIHTAEPVIVKVQHAK
jgi:ATP-dependent protease HslVU (ClpYQ) peptidase subunit